MTKKDVEIIARAIKGLCDGGGKLSPKDREEVAFRFANALDMTRPNFQAGRFIDACLIEGRETDAR